MAYVTGLFAQIPAGYYDAADGKSTSELKTALYNIVNNHDVVSYSGLWEAYETTDVVPNTDDQIFDMFSEDVNYYSLRGSEVNREHVVPQSWWGGGNLYPVYSDLFNVYPSEAKANSAKSNYPLGVITGKVTYDNGRTRVGVSNQSGGAPYVFEPADEFKGDFARIYFYVATCYQNISWVEKYYAFEGGVNDYPTLKSWILPTLLEWNRTDPVSEWEIQRQEAVYGIQKNRNPYIDYPILAEYVWGDSTSVKFELANAVPNTGQENGGDGDDESGDNDGGDNEGGDDDGSDNGDVVAGTLLFVETFDDVKNGSDATTGGSNSAWSGNDSIASASTVYAAGGAVRVGKAKGAGSLTTVPLNFDGGDLVVEVDVKGWTTIEGNLVVSVSGCESQTATYLATMSDDYETVKLVFTNASSSPVVTIETSSKRCFVSAIRVYSASDASGIDDVWFDKHNRVNDNAYYTLSGHRLQSKPQVRGFYIHRGNVVVMP